VTTTLIRAVLPCVLSLAAQQAAWAAEASERQPAPAPSADVGALFDERSVLTPKGTLIVEPSLQYVHSTTTQVAIEGYTVVPSLLIGLIDLSQIQRDTLTATLAFRYGLTRRMEVELRIPYVYREESVREREVLEGTPTDLVRDSDGHGLGDIEAAIRYQINARGNGPYWVANLRVKSRTGKDQFEVDRQRLFVEDDNGTPQPIGEVFTEQPTGSGFWSVQPSLSWIYPSDPVVLFGSISYLWNIERNVGKGFGKVDPGDAIGFNFGMGFAVNERTSFSLGYDHNILLETKQEEDPGIDAVFERYQIGVLLLGFSQRLSPTTSLNLSAGFGVTEFAPDVQLNLRLPIAF